MPSKWSAEAPAGIEVRYTREWNMGPRFMFGKGTIHSIPLPECSECFTPDELDALGHAMAAGPTLLRAAEAAETSMSLSADVRCNDSPGGDKRCGECFGCLASAALMVLRTAIALAKGKEE